MTRPPHRRSKKEVSLKEASAHERMKRGDSEADGTKARNCSEGREGKCIESVALAQNRIGRIMIISITSIPFRSSNEMFKLLHSNAGAIINGIAANLVHDIAVE